MKRLLLLISLVFLSVAVPALPGGKAETPDKEKGPAIRYYPNPVRTFLTVEVQLEYLNQYSQVEVKVVNLLGQEMIPSVSGDLSGLSNEIRVDLADIPSGIYFLEVYSTINGNTVKQTRKLTKS
jgi:hypothetical protein